MQLKYVVLALVLLLVGGGIGYGVGYEKAEKLTVDTASNESPKNQVQLPNDRPKVEFIFGEVQYDNDEIVGVTEPPKSNYESESPFVYFNNVESYNNGRYSYGLTYPSKSYYTHADMNTAHIPAGPNDPYFFLTPKECSPSCRTALMLYVSEDKCNMDGYDKKMKVGQYEYYRQDKNLTDYKAIKLKRDYNKFCIIAEVNEPHTTTALQTLSTLSLWQ